jgi:hypothetical protein
MVQRATSRHSPSAGNRVSAGFVPAEMCKSILSVAAIGQSDWLEKRRSWAHIREDGRPDPRMPCDVEGAGSGSRYQRTSASRTGYRRASGPFSQRSSKGGGYSILQQDLLPLWECSSGAQMDFINTVLVYLEKRSLEIQERNAPKTP